MVDPTVPGSSFFEVLESKEFKEAITEGVREAIAYKDLDRGIARFKEKAQQNGLDSKVVLALLLEVAKVIIKWYLDEQEKIRRRKSYRT